MRPSTKISMRTVIIIAVVGAFVLVGVTAGVGWLIVRAITSRVRATVELPKELEHAGILLGPGLLVKEPFVAIRGSDAGATDAQVPRLAAVTDIARGQFDGRPGLEIGIAWDRGALFVDDSGRIKSRVAFDDGAYRAQIIDVDGDGLCEFIGEVPPRMLDHTGAVSWTYRTESKWAGAGKFASDICGGDVDGDGRMEFAVAFIGFAGVHLVDHTGKMIWRKRGNNVQHVEMVDTNGDGRDEIVQTSAAGILKIRDGRGKVIGQARSPRQFPPFDLFKCSSLCSWPSKDGPKRLLEVGKDTIRLGDFDGKRVAEFKAPHCGMFGEARGTPVRLRAGQAAHLAVLVSFSNWDRSILYLYKPDGTLVYQEVFLGTSDAIAAVPLEESNREAMLVGGQERVWKYRLSDSAP